MSERYRLLEETTYEEEIRKSRFVARAIPVSDPAQAMAALARVREPSAHHNVWAWRVGAVSRCHDDGEPAGTGGRPVLQPIEGQGFDGVLVVVARWFGGVKLGTGGLVRAYGGCAAQCLRLAPREPWVARASTQVVCTYAELPVLEARLSAWSGEVLETTYTGEGAEVTLRVPLPACDAVAAWLTDMTRGRVNVSWQQEGGGPGV